MKISSVFFISLLFLIFSVSNAVAEDFQCGSEIISAGDRRYEVLQKCGNPTYVDAWDEVRIKRDFGSRMLFPDEDLRRIPLFVNELVRIEEWIYDLGPQRFVRYLRFENGVLRRITTGDYGS